MLLQKHRVKIIPVTPSGLNLPVVIAAAGERASRRFIEFLTANEITLDEIETIGT